MTILNVILWLVGIIYVLVCGWLVLVVLLQEGKSGGLSSAETASQAPGALTETFGAGGAQRGMFKVTAWSAGIFFALALALTIIGNKREEIGGALALDDAPAQIEQGVPAQQPAQPVVPQDE